MKVFNLKYEIEKTISLDEIKALLPADLSWEKNVRSYNFLPSFQLELLVENFRGESALQKISLCLKDLQEAVVYDIETQIMPSYTLEKTSRQFKIYWCLSEAEIPLKNILDWFEFFGWEIPKVLEKMALQEKTCKYINGFLNEHQIEFFHKLLDWQIYYTIPIDTLPETLTTLSYHHFEIRVREAIGAPSRKIASLYEID